MRFQCPECKAINTVDGDSFNQEIQCQTCGKTVRTPESFFAPGSIIDDFVIVKEIAKGGMGVVYLAQQLSLDRPAALKILQSHLSNDKSLVDSLIKEARLAAKLNHSNIVQAYAVGNDHGTIYFAMEYVDGPTMKSVLAEEKVLDFKRAASITRQIADALHFAWSERKLTHRDIKPDNIIIASNGRAKLADLGLSQIGTKSNVTESGEVLGTPQYISPEQLTGSEIDCRSDIYSLGATLFQFVTGRYAYVGKDTDEIAKQHVVGNLTPPKEINPAIPGMLNDIIVKMMALSPANRYQNAKEVRIALDKYIAVADTLNAASSSAGGGSAPAISIIKVATKKSTSEKKSVDTENQETEAEETPQAAVPKAVPKAAPKAAAPRAVAGKATPRIAGKAAAKPATAKPLIAGSDKKEEKEAAPAVVKGIAPKALTAKKTGLMQNKVFLAAAGVAVVIIAVAVLLIVTGDENAASPVEKNAPFAIEAKSLIAMAGNVTDEEFLEECDLYFRAIKISDSSQANDLANYQELRNIYAEKDEALRAAAKRRELLNIRIERAANAATDREAAQAAERERLRLREENERAIAERERALAKVSSVYLKELQADMQTAMTCFFTAIAEADADIFLTKTKDLSIFAPDYSSLTRKDSDVAIPIFLAAQQMRESLQSNLDAINKFGNVKEYISSVQFPWKKKDSTGKEIEYLFRIDDFDAEKFYLTDLYTDVKHEMPFAEIDEDSLKKIDALIDRKVIASKNRLENVVFDETHPRQNALFFNLMRRKIYAPWMKKIAPNDNWGKILDGIIRVKAAQ